MEISPTANVLPFSAKSPAFERRRHGRVPATDLTARPGGDHLELLDLSPRGMAIAAPHPFSVGGNYLFELLDDGRSLIVEGRVCWCSRTAQNHQGTAASSFRTGVSFVGIQSRSQTAGKSEPVAILLPDIEPHIDDKQFLADRIARLHRADSPDEAGELLLEILSKDFEHLVLFRIAQGVIRAWMGRGPSLVPERLRQLRVPFDRASIFLHLERGGSFFYGRLPAMFANLQLLRCWDGSLQRECVLFPVRLRHRLVAVLYADIGDHPLEPEHLRSVKTTVDLLTEALLEQILRRKRRLSQESDQDQI